MKDMQGKVAIVGAGVAGLTCASTLASAGAKVTVFDKGNAPGGRLATRTVEGVVFDHGAQYATARGMPFRQWMDGRISEGAAIVWTPNLDDPLAAVDDASQKRISQGDAASASPWYIGVPGMRSLVSAMVASLDIRRASEVTALTKDRTGWTLETAAGQRFGPYDKVALTAPALQTLRLLESLPVNSGALRDVVMAPCWALLLGFSGPVMTSADVFRDREGDISWMAKQSSRARPGMPEAWVVHASSDWSRRHLELEPNDAASLLWKAAQQMHPAFSRADPVFAVAHRWRYALTEKPLGIPYLGGSGIVAAGDWCLGARVEAAFDSGLAAGNALAATL